jgi:hypothetical protein
MREYCLFTRRGAVEKRREREGPVLLLLSVGSLKIGAAF